MRSISVTNILGQAMKPRRLSVMIKKVMKRLADARGTLSPEENRRWLDTECTSFEELAAELDPSLWKEAQQVASKLKTRADAVLSQVEFRAGGGGAYPFLYFLTRYARPSCVVETGVAAGFSSYAFLLALRANGSGRLYSSDFPYIRAQNAEEHIGVIVEDDLRADWTLLLDGDESNLPKILATVESVDIFHYDSDKSYSGRRFAMATVGPKLGRHGVVVMDDIQDNSFFHDYIREDPRQSWHVIKFEGKYVGILGDLLAARAARP